MKRIKLVALGTFLFLSTMIIAQKDNHSKFAIKFSPTQLVTGELHFAYEQRVMKQGSIELGIGPTVSEIGINSFFFENNLGYGGVLAESSLGFFTSLQFRYYPIEGLATAPRGLYIAPELKFRQYNTIYRDEITNLGERKGAINQISFKFFTGYQFWIGGRFAIDLFTAVGIGTSNITRHSVLQTYDPNTQIYTGAWHESNRSVLRFTGAFGVKFGFGGPRKDL